MTRDESIPPFRRYPPIVLLAILAYGLVWIAIAYGVNLALKDRSARCWQALWTFGFVAALRFSLDPVGRWLGRTIGNKPRT